MDRSRRRRSRDAALAAVLAAALAAAGVVIDRGALASGLLDGPTWRAMWPEIVTVAMCNTVEYTVVSFMFALAIAWLLAFMELSPLAAYRWLASAYIEVFRGLPALVVVLLAAFVVPSVFSWAPPGGLVRAGLAGVVMSHAAYLAQILGAAIQAVPGGQREAAESLGMSDWWTTASVVLPQAIRIAIPPLTNQLVVLVKDTSLLLVVGMRADRVELTAFGQHHISTSADASPLLAVAVCYLLLTLPISRLAAWWERRQRTVP